MKLEFSIFWKFYQPHFGYAVKRLFQWKQLSSSTISTFLFRLATGPQRTVIVTIRSILLVWWNLFSVRRLLVNVPTVVSILSSVLHLTPCSGTEINLYIIDFSSPCTRTPVQNSQTKNNTTILMLFCQEFVKKWIAFFVMGSLADGLKSQMKKKNFDYKATV